MEDAALHTLFRPWQAAPPTWGADARVLFLNGRFHPQFSALGPAGRCTVQRYAPWAAELRDHGEEVLSGTEEALGEDWDAALVLLGRFRDHNLGMLAAALRAVRPGGQVIACGSKREGAARYHKLLKKAVGESPHDVKHHCRVFWCTAGPHVDQEVLAAWEAAAAPRQLASQWWVIPGVFGAKKPDHGSRMLVDQLPDRLEGAVADLGAGYGFLGTKVLPRGGVTRWVSVEADALAMACARRNLAPWQDQVDLEGLWTDATTWRPGRQFDHVVCNPPHHEGARADVSIGQRFVITASQVLLPHGRLWMVANANLPYERVLQDRFTRVRTLVEKGGYKVIEARRPVLGRR